jgi:hypothetical protein
MFLHVLVHGTALSEVLQSMHRRFSASSNCTEALSSPMASAQHEMAQVTQSFDQPEYAELFEEEAATPIDSSDKSSPRPPEPVTPDNTERKALLQSSDALGGAVATDIDASAVSKGRKFEAQLIQLEAGALKRFGGTRCEILITDKQIAIKLERRSTLYFSASSMVQGMPVILATLPAEPQKLLTRRLSVVLIDHSAHKSAKSDRKLKVLWYGAEGEVVHRYSLANKEVRERFYEALFNARQPTAVYVCYVTRVCVCVHASPTFELTRRYA